MEREIQRVKRRLDEYYYYQSSVTELQERIDQIVYVMQGVKGVGFDNVKGIPETMESKIIRLGEQRDSLEAEIDRTEIEMSQIRGELGMDLLEDTEMRMIEMVHRDRKTYEQVAEAIGYAGKGVVWRKMQKIYGGMANTNGDKNE